MEFLSKCLTGKFTSNFSYWSPLVSKRIRYNCKINKAYLKRQSHVSIHASTFPPICIMWNANSELLNGKFFTKLWGRPLENAKCYYILDNCLDVRNISFYDMISFFFSQPNDVHVFSQQGLNVIVPWVGTLSNC